MGRRDAHGACPEWCVADHDAEREGGPVRHRGPTLALGAMLRHPESGAVAGELLIEMHQSVGDETVWIYIGDGTAQRDGSDQRLELSIESAARLARVLSRAAG